MFLLESGDIETNLGHRRSSFIKFCHWNLNGLAADDFVKMLLIEAFITTHKFDILCLSETFLDSSIDISDTRINTNGYSLTIQVNEVVFVCTVKTICSLLGKLAYLIFKDV